MLRLPYLDRVERIGWLEGERKGARAVALLMVALVCVLLPAQAATETTVWEGARLRVTTEPRQEFYGSTLTTRRSTG